MYNTQTAHSLNSQQKEAIGLLSIGTFLEYFDLLLYVHMAVLLNELFFPKADPFTAKPTFCFCVLFYLCFKAFWSTNFWLYRRII